MFEDSLSEGRLYWGLMVTIIASAIFINLVASLIR